MINRWQITALAVLAVGTAVFIEWWHTSAIHFGVWLRSLMAAAVIGAIVTAFEKYLWRWQWLQGWFVHRPLIDGAWTVQITPLAIDPSIGKPRSRRTYRYSVTQTYSTLFVRMDDGPESESESITADLRPLGDGSFELIATYRSVPRAKVRSRSNIHFGTVRLRVNGDKMLGSYWTDQKTHGEVEAVRIATTERTA